MIKIENVNESFLNNSPKDMAYKDLKTSLGDILFALGIFCEFLVSFRGNLPLLSEPNETAVSNIFILLGMLFFSLKILLSMDLKKDWMIFWLVAAVGVLSYKVQSSALILRIFLLLLAGRDQNAKKVCKFFFWASLLVMLVVGMMSVFGAYPRLFDEGLFRNENEIRYCFGFTQTNGLSLYLFRLLALFLYAYSGLLKWWGYLASAVCYFSLMMLTKSKMGIAIGFACYLLCVLVSLIKNDKALKLYYIVGNISLIGTVVFTYSAMLFYYGEYDGDKAIGFWEPINRLFTGRLNGAYTSFREIGVSLFGIYSKDAPNEMGFVSGLLCHGIVFIIIYLIILFVGFKRLYDKKDVYAMNLVIVGTLYSLAESYLSYANKNPVILALIGTGLCTRVFWTKFSEDRKMEKKNSTKKTIKLAFVDFWSDFNPKDNYFYNILNKHFDVEITENPDFVICSCFGQKHHKYRNAVKILFVGENMIPDFNLYDYALGFHYIDFEDRYLRLPLYVLYEDEMKMAEKKHTYEDKHYLDKKDFCSFVVSNPDGAVMRDEIFDALSNYKNISSGGRYRNNVGGPVSDKLSFVRESRFSLAIENSSTPGYTTEKILEAFAAETIPIYWGSPRIKEEFNEKAFIDANSYDCIDELVNAVKSIDEDDEKYLAMIKEPIYKDDSMSKTYRDEKYTEEFLLRIFNQSKEKAYRRNMVYYGIKYQNEMSDAQEVLSVVGLYRKVIHTLSKKSKQRNTSK